MTVRTGDSIIVKVADNGLGVPDALNDNMFAHGGNGLESDGTGAGTQLPKTLAERYGGEVWIDDNELEGAIFSVRLPIYELED